MISLIQTGKKNIRRLCAIAEVSPKNLYAHLKGPSSKEILDEEVTLNIMDLQKSYGNSLGYRKMADRLKEDFEIELSRRKVLKLMRKASVLSAVRRKHYTEEYYLTRRQMKETAPSDLIRREFFSLVPFNRFVCDITYLIGSDETWYLSVIEDLFNGEIVGWQIGEHCTTELCMKTVLCMKKYVEETQGCILHSDGGSTYSSYDYRNLLEQLGIKQSMGIKLTCYDNARIESFNAVFKTEALYSFFGKSKVKNHMIEVKQLAERVKWFIPYYNNERKKDSLGHMSPIEFRLNNPNGTYLSICNH